MKCWVDILSLQRQRVGEVFVCVMYFVMLFMSFLSDDMVGHELIQVFQGKCSVKVASAKFLMEHLIFLQ